MWYPYTYPTHCFGCQCITCVSQPFQLVKEVNKGWQCPGCNKCFAPHVNECNQCGQATYVPSFGTIDVNSLTATGTITITGTGTNEKE